MDKTGDPPWPLQEQTPAFVSFFSHKGGVGRTTALCAAAINLARAGQRVVIDLDLEAPGIATLLTDTAPALGVTDYLLERLLEHQSPINDFVAIQDNPDLISSGGEPIPFFTAGQLTDSYIEKLSRSDYELFVNVETDKNPMISLLKEARKAFSPSLILLDCLLSPSRVQGALEDVSSDGVDELAEEHPWARVLKKSLAGNTVPMARKEFAMLLKKTEWENGALPRHTQPEQLVDDLLSLGILRETEDKRIHIPDIYLYGFRLKCKGGMRRPKP